MPPLARAYIRAAFAYFIGAFALGALILMEKWLPFSRWLRVAGTSQLHLLTVGWITQLAIGVAYWMFPRFRKDQDPRPRGSDALAWVVLVFLNVGLLIRLIAEPFYLMGFKPWPNVLMALSGLLQAAAALCFGWLIWRRIRAMES
jgi:hypothetical protein